jgi:hypothetical protein
MSCVDDKKIMKKISSKKPGRNGKKTVAGPATATSEEGTVARRSTATLKAADDREVVPPWEGAPELSTPEGRKRAWQAEQRVANAARHAEFKEMVARKEEEEAKEPPPNPLLSLPEEQRARLFAWLRECPYDDAVQHMLKDQGIADATQEQLTEFFQLEAENHWEKRIERAALEANALVQLVERSPVKFSSGILAALGQESFRQIASGQVDPDAMNKMATLFLKARGDDRAEQMLALRREKWSHDWRSQTEKALEAFAKEVEEHPAARAAFEALRRELFESVEGAV